MQKIVLENLAFLFRCEGKILLSTLFGDNVFYLATLKNISVTSWCLPKKSYFGPCMKLLILCEPKLQLTLLFQEP